MGSYCYVPSCKVLETDATRGLKWMVLIRSGGAPSTHDQGPKLLPWVAGVRQTGGEILFAHTNHTVQK
jgi:hypothetical protein